MLFSLSVTPSGLLRNHAPDLFEQWKDKLTILAIYQQEILMWLSDLERIISDPPYSTQSRIAGLL